jgi:hypothetical protein
MTIAPMQRTDLPGLLIALAITVILILTAARFVWHRRDALFGRDERGFMAASLIGNDREEIVVFLWTGLALVLITFLFQLSSV